MSYASSQFQKQGSAGHQNQSNYHSQQDPYRAMSSQSATRGALPNAMNQGQTEIRYGTAALATSDPRFGGLYSSGNSSQSNSKLPPQQQQQQSIPKIPTITAPGASGRSNPSHSSVGPSSNVMPPRGTPVPIGTSFKQSNIPMSVPTNSQPSTPTSHPVTYSRATISELVQVPPELSSFAAEPQFQQILLKVKEQTMINFISLNRLSENAVESVAIDAPSKDAAILARNLIETHFKLQMKLKMAESRLQKVQTDLFSAQGDIASGMMVEFTIPSDLIGLVIGKKGSRIKQIEQETGVNSIHVNGESGRITVMGPDSGSVQRARENLELHEESFPLQPQHVEWLSNRLNSSTLGDIKQVSSLMVARVNRERCTLDVVGILASVRNARIMLATQLEYIDKQIEVENNEKSTREQLQAVRKQYNMFNTNQYNNRDKGGNTGANNDNSNKYSGNNAHFANPGASVHEGRRFEHDNRVDGGNTNNQKNQNNRRNNQNQKDKNVVTVSASGAATAGVNISTTSSYDSLLNLPPPPASSANNSGKNNNQNNNSNNQSQPTRVSNADLDSLIGLGLNTKPPSAARIGIHEEFLAAHMKSGRVVTAVPSNAETNTNQGGGVNNQQNKSNRRNNNNQNRDNSGVSTSADAANVDQQNEGNKRTNNRNKNQNKNQNNAANAAAGAGAGVSDEQGAGAGSNTNNSNNVQNPNNRNQNKNQKNKNQNNNTNSESSGVPAEDNAPGGAAVAGGSLIVTAPDAVETGNNTGNNNQNQNNRRNNQNQNNRRNQNNNQNKDVVASSPSKADAGSTDVVSGGNTTGNNNRSNNRRNNNQNNSNNANAAAAVTPMFTVVSTTTTTSNSNATAGAATTAFTSPEEKQRQLLSAVSIVSVVSSDSKLAGALASQLNINSTSKTATTAVPVGGGRSNGPAAKNNNHKDTKSASETMSSEPSATTSDVVAVPPAVPKRAKRTTGTAAVTVNDLNAAATSESAAAGSASPSIPPPPGMGSPRVSAPPPGL